MTPNKHQLTKWIRALRVETGLRASMIAYFAINCFDESFEEIADTSLPAVYEYLDLMPNELADILEAVYILRVLEE